MAQGVPFADLSRIHAPIREEILKRIASIIDRSAFVLGAEVQEFETEFANFVGSKHALGVASGLDALKLALQALGIGPGDEVITAANTFIATAFAISSLGAIPVLVDAELETYNLNPALLERAITKKTKAILPVHLYGQPASMTPILDIARAHGISVLEDVAQSHGAEYRNQSVGTFGEFGCFSFYPGKNLGAMGEGGAITMSSDDLREKVRILRDVGQRKKYDHVVIGHNSRLHTIQAAILSAKLPGLRQQNEDRQRIARAYQEGLKGIEGLTVRSPASHRTHVYHLFVVESHQRDLLQKFLSDRKIQTGIHYPVPIHLQPCYDLLGKPQGSFPVTEKLAKTLLSLPIFPGMRDDEIQTVVHAVREFHQC